MKPWRKAISSTQAILRPWRRSMTWTNCAASSREVVGPRIEPGEAAAEPLHMELARLHVVAVDIGDLELAAGRGLDRRGDIDHVRPVEIEPGRRPVRLRQPSVFLDRDRALLLVELDDAVALGIVDPIGEDGGAGRELAGLLQDLAEPMAEEEIVAETRAAGCPPRKSRPMMKACARPSGRGCSAKAMSRPHCLPSPSASR
jgi:hypothetical protein